MPSTSALSDLATEHEQLTNRRDSLQRRADAAEAERHTYVNERTTHLVAGRDREAAALADRIRACADERAALLEAVATIEVPLADVAARLQAQRQADELTAATAESEATRARLDAARRAPVEALLAFERDTVVPLMAELRAAHKAAAAAQLRLSVASGGVQPSAFDGALFAFEQLRYVELLNTLETLARESMPGGGR